MSTHKTGAELILAERLRQQSEEFFQDWQDDELRDGELLAAAECYLRWPEFYGRELASPGLPNLWPFADEDFKPSDDPTRNLEKAGALIAAEIDRIKRGTPDHAKATRPTP